MLFHSAVCPDSDITPPPSATLTPVSWSEICRSKNIHPFYPNNSKKMLFLDQEWQPSSPGPFLQFLRIEKVRGLCPAVPEQGMHVISLVRMSPMPFSLDPNICKWHATFFSRHVNLHLQQISFLNVFLTVVFDIRCRLLQYSAGCSFGTQIMQTFHLLCF